MFGKIIGIKTSIIWTWFSFNGYRDHAFEDNDVLEDELVLEDDDVLENENVLEDDVNRIVDEDGVFYADDEEFDPLGDSDVGGRAEEIWSGNDIGHDEL